MSFQYQLMGVEEMEDLNLTAVWMIILQKKVAEEGLPVRDAWKLRLFRRRKSWILKEELTIERARAFKSQNPFFMVTMRPSYLCGKVHMVSFQLCILLGFSNATPMNFDFHKLIWKHVAES